MILVALVAHRRLHLIPGGGDLRAGRDRLDQGFIGLRWKMSPAADKREADDDQRDTQSIMAR
jgi:hypothetical protein